MKTYNEFLTELFDKPYPTEEIDPDNNLGLEVEEDD
jgi:hypothetical protein